MSSLIRLILSLLNRLGGDKEGGTFVFFSFSSKYSIWSWKLTIPSERNRKFNRKLHKKLMKYTWCLRTWAYWSIHSKHCKASMLNNSKHLENHFIVSKNFDLNTLCLLMVPIWPYVYGLSFEASFHSIIAVRFALPYAFL